MPALRLCEFPQIFAAKDQRVDRCQLFIVLSALKLLRVNPSRVGNQTVDEMGLVGGLHLYAHGFGLFPRGGLVGELHFKVENKGFARIAGEFLGESVRD